MSDKPGPEIPAAFREIAAELVGNQGWRYGGGNGSSPVLYAAGQSLSAVRIPASSAASQRTVRNWVAQIRRAGGIWPAPERSGQP
jgi:hypothetical protein